jgi:hypothetical protein
MSLHRTEVEWWAWVDLNHHLALSSIEVVDSRT